MALKDRFRRAIGRDQRSASVSTGSGGSGSRTGTGGTTTPNNTDSPLTLTTTSTNNNDGHPISKDQAQTHTGANNNTPTISLTKTHSRLARSLTWGTSNKSSGKENKPSRKELKEKKAVEDWKRQDAEEWSAPKSSRPGRKNQSCQDTLRAFDFKQFDNQGALRTQSICSGISPSASRAGSVADGDGLVRVLSGGRKRSSIGKGGLSQEIEVAGVDPNGNAKGQRMTSVGEE